MDIQTATKLAAELDYCERMLTFDATVIDTVKQTDVNLLTLSEKYKEKLDLVSQDKALEKKRGDDFEKAFGICTEDLQKCEDSKPSRLTWFGAGVTSTLVLTLLTIIAF